MAGPRPRPLVPRPAPRRDSVRGDRDGHVPARPLLRGAPLFGGGRPAADHPGDVRRLRRGHPQRRRAPAHRQPGRHDPLADLRVRLRVPADRRPDEPAADARRVGHCDGEEAMIAAIVPVDHFLIMFLYALLASSFFALLWRETPRERWRLFGTLMASLV